MADGYVNKWCCESGEGVVTKQKTLNFGDRCLSPIPLVVTVCCRECDMESEGKRLDLYAAGWSDLVYERHQSWVWFDFSGVCPQCGEKVR